MYKVQINTQIIVPSILNWRNILIKKMGEIYNIKNI